MAREYTWAIGAQAAAAELGFDRAFGPPVVTQSYQDLYPGLADPAAFGKVPGDILQVEQLVGVQGEPRPRAILRYIDTAPADGWNGWVPLPFAEAPSQ